MNDKSGPSFELPPGWRQVDDKDLQLSLSIWLKITGKSLRNDLAERRQVDKDRAANLIAMKLVEHMRTCGWEITAPPPARDSYPRPDASKQLGS